MMLLRTVVVRAVGGGHVHAVGMVIGAHDEVRARLARRVRAVRRVGRGFGEIAGFPQRAVDLVRGNVVESGRLIARLHLAGSVHPVTACRFNEREGAHVVRFHEGAGALDGVVHMAFRGKVHDAPDVVFREQALHQFLVADVALHEGVVGHPLAFLQIVEIARVGELVEIDDAVVRILCAEVRNEIGTDEAGAAGNQYGCHIALS